MIELQKLHCNGAIHVSNDKKFLQEPEEGEVLLPVSVVMGGIKSNGLDIIESMQTECNEEQNRWI